MAESKSRQHDTNPDLLRWCRKKKFFLAFFRSFFAFFKSIKRSRKELGQYPAILTSNIDSFSFILFKIRLVFPMQFIGQNIKIINSDFRNFVEKI